MVLPLLSAAVGLGSSIAGKISADSAADDQKAIGRMVAQRTAQAGKMGEKAAKKASEQQIKGLNKAFGRSGLAAQYGMGYLQPYADAGQAGMGLYADVLGVNGPDAQAAAYGAYNASPGFQDAVDYGIDQAQQSAAAGGNMFSGGTLTELASRGQRMRLDDFYRWRDELGGLGTTGVGVAGQQVGISNQMGRLGYQNAADIGATRAGGTLGAANARIGGFLGATNALAGGQQNASALSLYGTGQLTQGINNFAGGLASYAG